MNTLSPKTGARPVLVKRLGAARAFKFEVAPGQTVTGSLPDELRPRVAVFKWVLQGDGSYKPQIKPVDEWVKINFVKELGLSISSDTVRRLGIAGVIEIRHSAPGAVEVNLASLDAHLEGCRDPEYWTTPVPWPDGRRMTRGARYREAI